MRECKTVKQTDFDRLAAAYERLHQDFDYLEEEYQRLAEQNRELSDTIAAWEPQKKALNDALREKEIALWRMQLEHERRAREN